MAEKKSPRLMAVIGLMNRISPPVLAEEWDNSGLQIGDPQAIIERVLICLDAEEAAFEEARRVDAQLIIAHHPLIFRPLKRISPAEMPGQLIFRAIRQGVAVAAAHTSLDRAADGLNDWLAAHLELVDPVPLEAPATNDYCKLVVFVPVGHETRVMDAMFAAGAGHIGAYDRCSFRIPGTGTFRGAANTDPFIGTPGLVEEAQELRLETIVPVALKQRVVERMIIAHPYEEVAYDLIPLANPNRSVGLGRVGRLAQATTLEAFARRVKQLLEVPAVRLVGASDREIRKVAVCGGSGMVTYADAVRHGADCLVTGDIKFHEAQRARNDGVALIDAGHFGTERIMIKELAARLTSLAAEHHYQLEVFAMTAEKDPFITVT